MKLEIHTALRSNSERVIKLVCVSCDKHIEKGEQYIESRLGRTAHFRCGMMDVGDDLDMDTDISRPL